MDRNTKAAFPHVVIRASAGSGKTYQLSNRYLALMAAGVAPHCILATTFTRKAAAEILDRVVKRLALAATNEHDCEQLAKSIGHVSLTPRRAQALLQSLLCDLHRLRIGTMDSFFIQLARSVSLEIGLPLHWQIVDDLQDSELRHEAVSAVIAQHRTSDLLSLTHLLTKGEASRPVGQLVRDTADNLLELFQETDETAWHQLPRPRPLREEELAQLTEELLALEFADGRFVRARDADHQRAAAGAWEEFVSKGIAGKVASNQTFYNKPIQGQAKDVYSKLVDHARAVLINRVASQTEGSHTLLSKFEAEYEAAKQRLGARRFSDVTRLLQQRLAAETKMDQETDEQLAFRLDGRIQHLLLDEFQDTAPAQWNVLQGFARRVTDANSNGSFFCVGDAKQAIYGWRGGVAEIFDALDDELIGLQQQQLNTSFRSAPPIIDTVNQVFTSLERHPKYEQLARGVDAWSSRFQEHATARTELPGYAILETAPDEQTVLPFAAARIAELHRQAPRNDLGILVRRNQAVAQLIGLLREHDVFASEEGGNPLTDSAAVQVLLSALRIADHPSHTVARFHLATSPLGPWLGFEDHCDHEAACRLSFQIRRALIDDGYGPLVARWAKELAPCCGERERSRLEQCVELAFRYQARATSRVDDFVRFIETQRVADPNTARVRVMTIHQAKGLQFDIVVLPELDAALMGQRAPFVIERPHPTQPVKAVCRYVNEDVQQLLPPRFQRMFASATDRLLTESLCVLYVALTRAVHALHMIIKPSAGGEKSLPQTYAGLLRAALRDTEPAPAGTTLYEHGDPDWARRAKPAEPPGADVADEPPRQIRLAPSGAARRRGLDRQSASGREGGARINALDLLRQDTSRAAVRGTILHAWFEGIQWLDRQTPSDAELEHVAEPILRDAAAPFDMEQLQAEFRQMLLRPSIKELLTSGSYLETHPLLKPELPARPQLKVECERPFAIREGNVLLTGSIDRLVWIRDGSRLLAADIIDFKSDRLAGADSLRAKTEFYRPQLEAYRSAIAKMTMLDEQRITLRLAFVQSGDVVTWT